MKRQWPVVGLGLGIALVMSVSAVAGGDGPIVRFNPADQAAARAALIRRSDLRPSSGWTGNSQDLTKADLAPLSCPGFHPKVSDLVITGAAAAFWGNDNGPSDVFSSYAEVFKTPHMVRLDWERSIQPSAATACQGSSVVNDAGGGGGTLVSFKRVAFPRIAPYTAAFQGLVNFEYQGKNVPLTLYLVVLARRRTEVGLVSSGRSADKASTVQLARKLASRIQA